MLTCSVVCLNVHRSIQYIERDATEHFHTLKTFPESLTKKVTLLRYFRNYMQEHLLKVTLNCRFTRCHYPSSFYCSIMRCW
jgi:hypothetical protein